MWPISKIKCIVHILVVEKFTCVLLLLVHCPSSLAVVLLLHWGLSSSISSGFSLVTVFLTLCFSTTVRPFGQMLFGISSFGRRVLVSLLLLYTCCPCWRGMSYYCFEYGVILYGESVI